MSRGDLDEAAASSDNEGRHHRLVKGTRTALSPLSFGALSILLGVIAGLGAWFFRVLIALVHNLGFFGVLSVHYNANQHSAPSTWGIGIIAVTVVGALVVATMIKRLAPEAKGHGVPEVIDAIYYHKAVIRPVVGVVKSVASAISIGTGGSVGREGPIVQIGSAAASLSGRLARASRWQRATLVAAGGGAGIAATFNTPIGGALFAVEILLHEVSVRTLVPVALCTTTATFVGRVFFGNKPIFPVPSGAGQLASGVGVLPASIVLGALMAFVSIAFIRTLYGAEDLFEKYIPGRDVLRHAAGMFGAALLFWGLMVWRGHYYIEGVGYATVMDVIDGTQTTVWFMVLLAALKLVSTCATLGSGGSGGIFSPSLFMGATLGGAFGIVLDAVIPGLHINPMVFALVGMASLIAGATGAALTAIVMLFEMTLDYSVILPLTLASAVSYGLRRHFLRPSIYTMKVERRGHLIPDALQANAHLVHHVADIALEDIGVRPADASPQTLELEEGAGPGYYAIVKDDEVVGVLSRDWALSHPEEVRAARTLGDAARREVVSVPGDTTVFDLMRAMQQAHATAAVVTSDSKISGIITKAHLAEALAEGMELFED